MIECTSMMNSKLQRCLKESEKSEETIQEKQRSKKCIIEILENWASKAARIKSMYAPRRLEMKEKESVFRGQGIIQLSNDGCNTGPLGSQPKERSVPCGVHLYDAGFRELSEHLGGVGVAGDLPVDVGLLASGVLLDEQNDVRAVSCG